MMCPSLPSVVAIVPGVVARECASVGARCHAVNARLCVSQLCSGMPRHL